MKPFYFFVNTVNRDRPSFAIFDNGGHILCSYKFIDRQENLVKEFEDFLKKGKASLAEIGAVLVISGPGSFSASRAGIVFANSLNFVNKVPVLGIKDTGDSTEELIKNNLEKMRRVKKSAAGRVCYQKEPDITIK